MRGIVVHYERRIGFIAIRDSKGEFLLAELLGGYVIEKGDVISGNADHHGSQTLLNETKGERITVFIQGFGMTEKQIIRMMQNTR